MVTIIRKTEFHYPDISLYGTLFDGVGFIANGLLQIKNEHPFPFTIIGRALFGNWDYQYFCQKRLSNSQMQSLRLTAKNFPAGIVKKIDGEELHDINNLEILREKVHQAILGQMIRIYPGRESEAAKQIGAVFYGDVQGWFLPPHLELKPFEKWLKAPTATESTPVYTVKEKSQPVIVADPNENLSVVFAEYPDKSQKLVNITRVGKSFETAEGVRAYHYFEIISLKFQHNE